MVLQTAPRLLALAVLFTFAAGCATESADDGDGVDGSEIEGEPSLEEDEVAPAETSSAATVAGVCQVYTRIAKVSSGLTGDARIFCTMPTTMKFLVCIDKKVSDLTWTSKRCGTWQTRVMPGMASWTTPAVTYLGPAAGTYGTRVSAWTAATGWRTYRNSSIRLW